MATLHLRGYSPGVYRLTATQRKRVEQFVDENRARDPIYIVNGYSSSSSNHELNFALSTERANEVSRLMISLAVPNDKIAQRSFGERLFSGNDELGQLTMSVVVECP